MLTVIAFIVALGILIAVHEYGHYRMAVACGVKVERFSVGFGKVLLSWRPRRQRPGQDTEFVIGAFPLGGYVRMLDEREAPVPASERHLAFNTQPLKSRAAVVAAGPLANLLLAVALYAFVAWWGVEEPAPVLASPVAGSIAQQAGLRGGERVSAVGLDGDTLEPVVSFEELRWYLTQAVLEGRDLVLQIAREDRASTRELRLAVSQLPTRDLDAQVLRTVGLPGPWTAPVLGEILASGAASRLGLREGDRVLSIDGAQVIDGRQLRELIRAQVQGKEALTRTWRIERAGQGLDIEVTPDVVQDAGRTVGRLGAYVGAAPEFVTVRKGALDGLASGFAKTWEMSVLTVRMMGRMLIGEASLKHLSGPLTIADYAGKSASLGFTAYLLFLALISVSLGVLNLLPLPVLDGGHLMYYLYEGVVGRPVPPAWLERLQRGGFAVLAVMMSIALFNDVSRLFG